MVKDENISSSKEAGEVAMAEQPIHTSTPSIANKNNSELDNVSPLEVSKKKDVQSNDKPVVAAPTELLSTTSSEVSIEKG